MTRSSSAVAALSLAAALAAVLATGCASAPKPNADLARAHTLVDQAEQSGAPQFASADLSSARSKLQQADQDARPKPEEAVRLAQEASADARVAMARTDAAKAQAALHDVNAGTQTLRRETERSQSTSGDTVAPAAPPPVATPPMPQ